MQLIKSESWKTFLDQVRYIYIYIFCTGDDHFLTRNIGSYHKAQLFFGYQAQFCKLIFYQYLCSSETGFWSPSGIWILWLNSVCDDLLHSWCSFYWTKYVHVGIKYICNSPAGKDEFGPWITGPLISKPSLPRDYVTSDLSFWCPIKSKREGLHMHGDVMLNKNNQLLIHWKGSNIFCL